MLFLEPKRALVWTMPPASPGTQIATLKAKDASGLHLWRPGLMHSLAPEHGSVPHFFPLPTPPAAVVQLVIFVLGH